MVARADAEPNDVRSRALAAATRLFAEKGFDGTSIQLIADEVGVSKPAVLHHFPSKEDLRRAVLDAIVLHWQSVLPRLLLAASRSDDRFDAVFGELHRFFASDSNRARLVVRELFDRPGEAKKLLRGAVRPWLSAIAAYIKEGQAHGRHWEDVDPEAYVVHILQLVVCASASANVSRVVIDPDYDGGAAGTPADRYDRELARIARASLFKPISQTAPRKTARREEKPR